MLGSVTGALGRSDLFARAGEAPACGGGVGGVSVRLRKMELGDGAAAEAEAADIAAAVGCFLTIDAHACLATRYTL